MGKHIVTVDLVPPIGTIISYREWNSPIAWFVVTKHNHAFGVARHFYGWETMFGRNDNSTIGMYVPDPEEIPPKIRVEYAKWRLKNGDCS